MLLKPKDIDWDKLKRSHTQYRETLKGIDTDRRLMIQKMPDLLRERKKAKEKYKAAVEDANTLTIKISHISNKIKELRQAWLNNGGTTDNFYLNLEANKHLAKFAEYKEEIKEVRFTIPKNLEKVLKDKEQACKDLLKDIKKARSSYRSVQRVMDLNSTKVVVTNYQEEVAHTYDAYLELQRFQLSIKKRKIHIANKVAYVKMNDSWHKIDRYGDPEETPCTIHEVRELEKKINKYLR